MLEKVLAFVVALPESAFRWVVVLFLCGIAWLAWTDHSAIARLDGKLDMLQHEQHWLHGDLPDEAKK